jgi:hypothetical protein
MTTVDPADRRGLAPTYCGSTGGRPRLRPESCLPPLNDCRGLRHTGTAFLPMVKTYVRSKKR